MHELEDREITPEEIIANGRKHDQIIKNRLENESRGNSVVLCKGKLSYIQQQALLMGLDNELLIILNACNHYIKVWENNSDIEMLDKNLSSVTDSKTRAALDKEIHKGVTVQDIFIGGLE